MNRADNKSAAQWETIVAEFCSSSESEREFCSRRDIKLITLRKW
jgi:hypothetical protein